MATGLSLFLAVDRNCPVTDFATIAPERKQPARPGVHDLLGDVIKAEMGIAETGIIHVQPFGTADHPGGKTFLMQLWGWSKLDNRELYVPKLLAEAKVKLGDIEGKAIGKKTYMAESITLKEGVTDPNYVSVCNPGGDAPAHLELYVRGSRLIEFNWGRNGSPPATSANAFWSPLS